MQDVKTDRAKYIGGSDIPIIMGISPFKTRFDLLLEKAELKDDDFEGNEYTEYGNIMESKIRDYINESLGKDFKEGKHIEGDIRIHTDGENYNSILEIKTTSQVHNDVNDYKVYLVQLLFYMYHTKKDTGILAVYDRPEDFNQVFDNSRLQVFMIDIGNYKELIEEINKAVEQFKQDLVKVKENPLITEEELLPVDVKEIAEKVIALENRLAEYKEIEKESKEVKESLKQAMERNGLKKWTTLNNTQITLIADTQDKEEKVKLFNEDKFKQENEDLYNKYVEEQTKITKGKKGSIRITLPKEA